MRSTQEAARFAGALLQRLGRNAAPATSIRDRIGRAVPNAAAVLAPDSADAVAEVLAICSAEGWPVRVAGAATMFARDVRPVIVLSCHRLDAVTEHEPADLVVGAGVGIPLSRLSEALAEHGQWLPLDPPDAGGGTLGGAVAGNAAGPLRAGHGTPRDMTLGAEVVTGDGRRLRFGGRVVKNVAGYDVVRLLVGSGGRLGALTHAFVRLRGRPHRDETLLIGCGSGTGAAAAACRRALRIRDAVRADALEVVSAPSTVGPREWLIAVRLQGGEAGVAAAVEEVRRLEPAARHPEAAGGWWRGLSLSEAAGAEGERVSVLPGELAEAAAEAALRTDHAPSDHTIAMHVSDGVLRAWRSAGGERSGSLLDGIVPARRVDARLAELTQRLCAVFDPAGILQRPEQPID